MNYCEYPEAIEEKMYGGVKESEVVDELMQILIDCVKREDVRGQEILLRKFFFEIEKEIPLQGFLLDRLKHSKISSLFGTAPASSHDYFRPETEIITREVNVSEAGETSEKLERFKVKTVQVGDVVKEEKAR